jgi:hypothetical protein
VQAPVKAFRWRIRELHEQNGYCDNSHSHGLFSLRGLSVCVCPRGADWLFLYPPWQAGFAATNLAMNIVEKLDSMVATGAIAGLFGATCLAAASAALLPFLRRWPSCLGAIAAGCALGGLLAAVDVDSRGADWLLLYPPWQAAFAAALFAVAPPRRG